MPSLSTPQAAPQPHFTESGNPDDAADAPVLHHAGQDESGDPHPSLPAPVRAGWKEGLVIAVVVLVVGAGAAVAFDPAREGLVVMLAGVGAPTLVLAVLALVFARKTGELGQWLRPAWGDFSRGVGGAAAFMAATWAVSHALAGTPREAWLARVYLKLGDPSVLRDAKVWVGLFLVSIAAAEEIVWRGLVTRLVERFLPRTGWLVAAVPYALAHAATLVLLKDDVAGPNPLIVLAALFGGVLWGGMVKVTGRLPPAIVAHASFDWCVVMLFRMWGPSV
jgi:membrane protease YdiL (CAAX protease family)